MESREKSTDTENEFLQCNDIFCNLEDIIGKGGKGEAISTVRFMSGWKIFRELIPFLIMRVTSLYVKIKLCNSCVSSTML